MTITDADLRILKLTPEHYDHAECFLCGQYGEDVDWYATYSPESHRALQRAARALDRHGIEDTDVAIAADIAEAVDPIANEYGGDFNPVCTSCADADPPTLRRRIRANADELDEAGYSAPYGPDSDDLADHTLRDRGLWVRRHHGYELAVIDDDDQHAR